MELLIKLDEEMRKPHKPKLISSDEYRTLFEMAQFKCPANLRHFCGGHRCPPRPDNIHEDYYEECCQSNKAKNLLMDIQNGKIVVLNGNSGWRIPG